MSDLVVFEDNSIRVKNLLKDKAISFLYEVGSEVESLTKDNSRTATSDTKGSYHNKVVESDLAVYIGSDHENAIWEEFGTGVHAINRNGRKTPWYVPVDKVRVGNKPTYKGKVEIVYTKSGIECYKTDGKKANRPLFNAYESSKSKIIARAEEILGELST